MLSNVELASLRQGNIVLAYKYVLESNRKGADKNICLAIIAQYFEINYKYAKDLYFKIIKSELINDENKWSKQAHLHLAIINAVEGNDFDAENNFKRAVWKRGFFKSQLDAEILFRYGMFCQLKGRQDQATSLYRQAIGMDKKYAADISMAAPTIEMLKKAGSFVNNN